MVCQRAADAFVGAWATHASGTPTLCHSRLQMFIASADGSPGPHKWVCVRSCRAVFLRRWSICAV